MTAPGTEITARRRGTDQRSTTPCGCGCGAYTYIRYGRTQGYLHGHNLRLRDQRGERNRMWRGHRAKYAACHLRVIAVRGQPAHCEVCGTTDPRRIYEWANLTGNLADVMDYRRMCQSCHRRFDGVIQNIHRYREARAA